MIGVNERGQKKFLAIEDGVRESTQSWREVLLELSAGFAHPAAACGRRWGVGFWAALEEIYPQTRHQRCWKHKTVNALNYFPRAVQPKAKAAVHEIWMAETKADAERAFDQFSATFGAKYPKAVECLAVNPLQS